MNSIVIPAVYSAGVSVTAEKATVQSSSSSSSSAGPIKVVVKATPLPVDRLQTLLRKHISSIPSTSIEDSSSSSSCSVSGSSNTNKLSDLVAEAPVLPTVLLAYDPIYNLASFGGTTFHCELRSKPMTDYCSDLSNSINNYSSNNINSNSTTNLRVSQDLESKKRILVVTSNEIIECSIVEDHGTCSTVRVASNRELTDLFSIKSMKCKEKSELLGFYDVLLVYRSGSKFEYRLENAKYLIELISLNLSAKGVDSHARKQKNPYLVNAESYMHRVDALMQQFDNRAMEAKPPTTKEEDDERSIELIEIIMSILREATENFSCLSDGSASRYEEVIARMKAFLSRFDVIKLLDDSYARRKSLENNISQQHQQQLHEQKQQQQQLHEQRQLHPPQVKARLVQNTKLRQVIVASNGEKDVQYNTRNASTNDDDVNMGIESSHSHPLISSTFIIEEEHDSDSDCETFVDIDVDADESISKLMRSFSAFSPSPSSSSSSSETINLNTLSTSSMSIPSSSSNVEIFSIDNIKLMMANKSFIDEC